jgi:hypothetical protein
MALPKLNVAMYETTIPSTGKNILYRGFLRKEEKILLLALQTEDNNQINIALKQIITNCTNGKANPDTLPIFDIEYLYLKIVTKSTGEELELNVKCDKCNNEVNYTLNLDAVQAPKIEKDANLIKLAGNVGIKLKYPTIDGMNDVSVILEDNKASTEEEEYNAIINNIEFIYDEEGVYYTKDQTKEELYEFLNSLSGSQITEIKNFYNNIPTIEDTVEFTCNSCGHENKYLVRGLQDFFG